MNNIITVNLKQFGYSENYTINSLGQIYNTKRNTIISINDKHQFKIRDNNNNSITLSLKPLYRKVFNTEFCIDNIQDLPEEHWKEIKNSNGKLFISNYGRIKSYFRYNAIILSQQYDKQGYSLVKIQGIKYLTHRLVAKYFVENDNPTEKTVVHHTDRNPKNNKWDNLIWLTDQQHREIHKELRKNDSLHTIQ